MNYGHAHLSAKYSVKAQLIFYSNKIKYKNRQQIHTNDTIIPTDSQ